MKVERIIHLRGLLLLLFSLGITLHTHAQISGKLVDEKEEAIISANVLLLNYSDSSLFKGQISKVDGSFSFKNVKVGKYLVKIYRIGFEEYFSKPISIKSIGTPVKLGTISLEVQEVELGEVEITAQKQLFEQKIDRMVVNVSASETAAGNTALEVLERSPGVILDRSNNSLALAGKNGVVVMINGKRNYMPISGVIQLLAGMSADEIEKIELITTPPANFDAEGNAGYINIVLKDNSNYGLNGSVTLTGGYGRGERSNASLSLNYRRNKFNIFGTYSFLLNNQEQTFAFSRDQLVGDERIQTATVSDRLPQQLNHNLRVGMDYQISKKTVLGILAATYDTKWTMDAFNNSTFTYSQRPDTLITLELDELNQWRHYMGNVNLQHNFTEQSSLTFNVDYLYYRDNNPTNYDNSYFNEEGDLIRQEQVKSEKLTPINIGVGSLDFKAPLGDNTKLETGVKATISRFTNDVRVSFNTGTWTVDQDLTGIFFLEEEIGAAYAAIDGKLGEKTTYKAGLRYEYTQSNLSSQEQQNIVDRKYGNLFPSLFLSRNIGDYQSVNLSYSRRITRPTFNDMAPFVIFIDPQTFFSGNAALQPSISDAIKLDYRIKNLMFSLSYTYEDSSIANFQARIDPETGRQIIAAENLQSTNTLNLTATLPIKITDWWDMIFNLNGTYTQVNLFVDEQLLSLEQPFFSGFSSQKFKLPGGIGLELSGFYRSKVLFGTSVVRPTGLANIGIRKQLGDKGSKGTLTFNVNDIFNSLEIRPEVNLPEVNLVGEGLLDFSQRTFLLTYSMPLGNKKVKAARNRQTASEEERRRVN
ncbi:MAG: outer membrane beta-barrel protein [Bacteroidia bacterium]|nr:outer membrane beta-barrel protein [Bacteroidia bacterium]